MTLSKYSKRHVQFEALEAKQLFAADFVGGAAADLADTAVVAEYDPGDNTDVNFGTDAGGVINVVAEYDPGDNTDIDLVPENVRTNLGGIKTNQESVAAAGIDQSGLVNNISRMDSDTEVIELTHNIENGRIDRRSGSIMSTGHLVVDGEGLYQRNELELASNLGGQEGEPLMNTSLADHLMVEGESLQSYDHTGIIDPNDCPRLGGQEGEPLVLAEDAENIQWGVGRGVAETENIQQLGGQEGEDFDLDPGDQRLQVAAVLRYIHYS